ncbi:MAG: response regulator transcription factor [Acutalibacteraceae bacterium]|nr:response regulator transcription factor [Acutalibacteraceae bacterium]
MYRILMIEDDENICEIICDFFAVKSSNIKFDIAKDGEQGVELAYENIYDLLLLDVMLPRLDGFSVCKEVRRYSDIPIIFMTARISQEDMLEGYGLGCDDYIVKPFSLPVFYEKVNALIKRSKGLVRYEQLSVGSLSLNPNNGIVISDGEEVKLTAKEFAVLKLLLENKGKVVSRDKIITNLWGYDSDVDERVLDTHIKNLRRALKGNSKLIKTIIKRGYKMEVN